MYSDHPTCACITAEIDENISALGALKTVRDLCLALRNVLLPDQIWADFWEWHLKPDTVVWHRSKLMLALQRGCLGRLTGPVHRYLMSGSTVRSDVRNQYLKDLPEQWMQYSDPMERHRRSRQHDGRIAELQCAEWLEERGWNIVGLEAHRLGADIEARLGTGRIW